MKELVEVIAKALVDHPEEVSVNEKNEGRIAKAIRSVVKAAAAKEDKKVVVDIM